MEDLHLYNTLSREKEKFEPINPPFVGLYVCGPTVYSDPHLGNMRSALTFDTLFRYLKFLEYRVRYVRNITDVGHLESDGDTGDDKMEKQARLEQKEPMEIAHYYTERYHGYLRDLNMLPPSIEPTASGHIPEQISMVEQILENGLAYESNGSVYLNVPAYDEKFPYGKLSGRSLEDMQAGYRDLEGQEEKKHPADFAIWKYAGPEKLMKWDSPWGSGVPGWHLECTVMSTKYLGPKYDIHGGGLDLIFPHHEAEITQSNACHGYHHPDELDEAKYWVHNNMVTMFGVKMSKSRGNTISLDELYTGESEHLSKAYDPITIRFFMLQAHYRSTVDFSDQALLGSEKAFGRLSEGVARVNALNLDQVAVTEDAEKAALLNNFATDCRGFMNDDLNTAKVIARMFDTLPIINAIAAKQSGLPVSREEFEAFRSEFNTWFGDVLGLKVLEGGSEGGGGITDSLMDLVIALRKTAKSEKNWGMADQIRDQLKEMGVVLRDTPDGTEWSLES